jgi:hypothetical protein
MKTSRTAVLLAIPLAAIALVASYGTTAHPTGPVATLACYVALANDLTPLVDRDAPDAAASSPECAKDSKPANQDASSTL